MFECDEGLCCGCGACAKVCPKGAITMVKNSNCSFYPVVDSTKCINCSICDKVCPYKQIEQQKFIKKCYAIKNKDDKIRKYSSSGGVFLAIAKYIIDNGGIVLGCECEGKTVKHTYTSSFEDCKKYCGSKYTESYLGDCFQKVKEFLEKGKKVLFTGTPCQVNGLKLFLRKDYDNLYTVDFICHGVPVKKVFDKYIDELEKKYNSKVVDVCFRDKTYGWTKFSMKLNFENGITYIKDLSNDTYMRIFLSDIALRDSCFNCSAKGDDRKSDITLGDFWGLKNICPDFFDDKGVSLVLTNSKMGEKILNSIKDDFDMMPVNKEKAISFNSAYSNSVTPHKNRDKFFRDFDRYSLGKLAKKYVLPSFPRRVLGKIKHIIKAVLRKIKTLFKKLT